MSFSCRHLFKLPRRTTVVISVVIFALISYGLFLLFRNNSPDTVVAYLNQSLAERSIVAGDWKTSRGQDLLKYIIMNYASVDNNKESALKFHAVSKDIQDHKCRVACYADVNGERFIGDLVLMYADGKWRFDNIFVERFGDYKIGTDLSLLAENPTEFYKAVGLNNPALVGSALYDVIAKLLLLSPSD